MCRTAGPLAPHHQRHAVCSRPLRAGYRPGQDLWRPQRPKLLVSTGFAPPCRHTPKPESYQIQLISLRRFATIRTGMHCNCNTRQNGGEANRNFAVQSLLPRRCCKFPAAGSWGGAVANAISQMDPSQRPFAADQAGAPGSWLQDASTSL